MSTSQKPVLAIILPCFNEEDVLPISLTALLAKIDSLVKEGMISSDSYILCVDDGSTDHTWSVISEFNKSGHRVKAISLAHNRGQQTALLAGMLAVRGRCDAAVTLDADLQDDPSVISRMIQLYTDQGKEIIYGVREQRASDSWLKRSTAHQFYRLQRNLGLETIYDHADFRFMSSRALDIIADYGETNLFLRGIIPQIGLDSAIVKYPRGKRVGGKSKYDLRRMINFSLDGITSFTTRPIRLIFSLGLIMLIASIIVAIYVFTAYFRHDTISGWTSIMLSIWFLGSLILMSIGIVGEYVGKVFTEVKHRPRFVIKKSVW